MRELGLVPPEVPSPLNLFREYSLGGADGTLVFAAPPHPKPEAMFACAPRWIW